MKTTVQLTINKHWTVAELEEAFTAHFPNLGVEVYRHGQEVTQGLRTVPLQRIGNVRQPTNFEITEKLTVAQVIEQFKVHLGIRIAVMRKLANSRLETTFTSQWTLQRQNDVGGEVYAEFQQDV